MRDGWTNNGLKAREKNDPWFRVNDSIQEAYMLGEMDKVEELKVFATKFGGPHAGLNVGYRGYALHTDNYDKGLSASRAQSALD